jgi:acyl-coenzyme A thioesterase PaaI-like protein
MATRGSRQPAHNVVADLGFDTVQDGDDLRGSAQVLAAMWAPGTEVLRTSILATWADIATGLLAVGVLAPRVPVTLELDVHLYRRFEGEGAINAIARTVKAGRSVVVLTVDFTDAEGDPVAVGNASFMAAPDTTLTMPADRLRRDTAAQRRPLEVPYAERARCVRREPGVAVIGQGEDTFNASGSLNGGLIALAIEEAALSLTPGATLSSMSMRYLRPVRSGPAVATAYVRSGLGRIEVRDAGAEHRLAVAATTRIA